MLLADNLHQLLLCNLRVLHLGTSMRDEDGTERLVVTNEFLETMSCLKDLRDLVCLPKLFLQCPIITTSDWTSV